METKEAEKITEEFFKERFPDKDIAFEKQCGYFGEWVERFKSGYPEYHMDNQSLRIWDKMKKMEIKKCCFCEQDITGYGNNPAPVKANNLKCCDKCNFNIVIPARMKIIGEYKEK